jgi:hypothetical protein
MKVRGEIISVLLDIEKRIKRQNQKKINIGWGIIARNANRSIPPSIFSHFITEKYKGWSLSTFEKGLLNYLILLLRKEENTECPFFRPCIFEISFLIFRFSKRQLGFKSCKIISPMGKSKTSLLTCYIMSPKMRGVEM